MNKNDKQSVHVQIGENGNPEVEVIGTVSDAKVLCTCLMASLAATDEDPVDTLSSMMVGAADLLDRMEG